LAYRDRKEAIFSVLRLIFYGKSADAAKRAVDMADVDPDMLFEWIYENLPYHLRDPVDLAQAMDSLATADLYRGRIRRTQDWTLTRYVIDFMTAGVAMAREKTSPAGFVPLRFPERIRVLSKTRSERQMQGQIGLKVKKRCHMSTRRAIKEILPYLRIIFENDAEMAVGLVKWLDLDEPMIEYLAGTKRRLKAILKVG
jgi:replication factor C large subunit